MSAINVIFLWIWTVSFCFVFLLPTSSSTDAGLSCYNCTYEAINGTVFGDKGCRSAANVRANMTLIPCSNDTDALNYELIETTRLSNPEAKFHFGCVLTEIRKSFQMEVVIRGCFAKEIIIKPDYSYYGDPTTTPPPEDELPPPIICDNPGTPFWKMLRDGSLSENGTRIDTTSAILSSCFCDVEDGCNSSGKLNLNFFLLIFSFSLISVN